MIRHRLSTAVPAAHLALIVFALSAAMPFVAAQEKNKPAPSDGKALINQAYALTKNAKTVEQFTEIIDLCDQARQAGLTDAQANYIERLTSWALNRRGEQYADRAAQQAGRGESEKAAQLDAKALADFQLAIEKDPANWKAIHNRGVSYAQAGKLREALDDFTRVTQMRPNYAKAWYNRGETHYTLGQFEQALADYSRALRLRPNDFAAHISRGHAYFQLKRFRSALADYDRAVSLNPQSGETLANRADAYQSLGLWRRAAADYRRAIALDDQLGRAYQSAAWLMATCPDARFRNDQLALQRAQEALQLAGPDDYRCLDTLAAAQANAGQFDEAKATLAKAIKKAPEDQREPLQRRLKLYEQGQPYRQGMFRQPPNAP